VDRINPPRPPQRRRSAVLAAAGAFVLGVLYAAISGYWGSGGTALLASVGGVFQRAGRNGSVAVLAVVWLTVLLKLLAASLGAVVVAGEPRIDVRRRRQLRMVSWAAASVLVIYGGVLSIIGWLVQIGIVSAGAHADHEALRWHAYVWDPRFLVWGLLLAAALLRSRPLATLVVK